MLIIYRGISVIILQFLLLTSMEDSLQNPTLNRGIDFEFWGVYEQQVSGTGLIVLDTAKPCSLGILAAVT